MSDASRFQPEGPTPREALRGLPLASPPRPAWSEIAARLPVTATPTRRRSTRRWLALAATLALALALPMWRGGNVVAPPQVAVDASTPNSNSSTSPVAGEELDTLLRESAQLEAWVAWSSAQGGETGASASVELDVRDRIAAIDALLSRPALDPAAQLPLWQERVLRLRQLAGLHNTRQLLAANGDGGDAAPVTVF
jgi:hypothetical protein